ncbi:uncharacterized protein MELLADRAFT_111658 [Melampsora larici-populina 98AG31]|uniref:Uncharacterized protein n=1 Tax=Melampsora larici-populina (strain 98AG31 / pathotype 3-4-7) TaxID=747676 RepID=F4S3X8_MELLP|nr:uncharacterized protein MELLADRAFT_111658 [Melampsora larici-populina 98AG31]EGG00663.1 hypothetical protein MELLADRAFT_111658 [Melampsora larici-populina 98AG31]
MAPSTRASSRASSISDTASTTQPTGQLAVQPIESGQSSTSSQHDGSITKYRAQDRIDLRKTKSRSSGTTVPPPTEQPSVDPSTGRQRLDSLQSSNSGCQRVSSQTYQEDRIQTPHGVDPRMEPNRVGLDHVRKESTTSKENSIRSSEVITPSSKDDESRGDLIHHRLSGESFEELDRTILPLDREMLNPFLHHIQTLFDPIVYNSKKLTIEIISIKSLFKKHDQTTRLDHIDQTLTDLIDNVNNQVKSLNSVSAATQALREEQIEFKKQAIQNCEKTEYDNIKALICEGNESIKSEISRALNQCVRTVGNNIPDEEDEVMQELKTCYFCEIFEEVVDRTTKGKQRFVRKDTEWKTQATTGTTINPKSGTSRLTTVRIPGKCDTCGSEEKGHDFRACRRKSKTVNMIDQDDHPEEETPTPILELINEDVSSSSSDDETEDYNDLENLGNRSQTEER